MAGERAVHGHPVVSSAFMTQERASRSIWDTPGADYIEWPSDEFTCSQCFLVHHRSQLARETNGVLVCRDCAA